MLLSNYLGYCILYSLDILSINNPCRYQVLFSDLEPLNIYDLIKILHYHNNKYCTYNTY